MIVKLFWSLIRISRNLHGTVKRNYPHLNIGLIRDQKLGYTIICQLTSFYILSLLNNVLSEENYRTVEVVMRVKRENWKTLWTLYTIWFTVVRPSLEIFRKSIGKTLPEGRTGYLNVYFLN